MNTAVHFSSARQTWSTPAWLYRELDAEFHFTLDAAASPDNATCLRYFTIEDNGLVQDWLAASEGGCIYLNPPYRTAGQWIAKAAEEAKRGATVVMLVPARPDTAAWHRHILNKPNVEIRFLRGRLKFGDAANSAPFPSAIVIMRPLEASA